MNPLERHNHSALAPAQDHQNTVMVSATPYSLESLEKLVPDWLGRDMFDLDFVLPAVIPDDGPRRLRNVAARFENSLQDRPNDDDLDHILGELMLRTVVRNEGSVETISRFELLKRDCRSHPTEALREAAFAYAKENKFFPAGYGELLPFIMKAQNARSGRITQLRRAAKQAETELANRQRLHDDPVDPEAVSALVRELEAAANERSKDTKKRDYSNLRMPTQAEVEAVAAELGKKA
jgi:hypothetical protein